MQFDVIVPCYNYARYLRGCVESILTQEGVAVRVLIIDDCSPDNTPEVGRALGLEDPRVEYRRHATNLRHISTYNEGFEWVSGDVALLLSADDLLTPGSLARGAQVFQERPEVGLVWGRQILFNDVAPAAATADSWSHEIFTGAAHIERMCRTGSNPVMTPTALVRAPLLKSLGGYHPDLTHSADMLYWLRCAARGSVAFIDADQAYKRMHGQNMQVEYVSRRVRDLDQQWQAFDVFFDQEGHLVPHAIELRLDASRSLASQAFWAASEAFDRGAGEQVDELLDFARQRDPNLPHTRDWSRLAWKRRLGGRVWRAVRPVVNRLRRQPALIK